MQKHDTNLTIIEERIFQKMQQVAQTAWVEAPPEVLLDSISITQPPIKSSYYIGDTLDLTGLEITAYYTDESSRVLLDTEYTLTIPPDIMDTEGVKTITASFTDGLITKTAEFNISVEVVPQVLVNIAIEHLPNKIQYTHEETFETEGLIVKAFFDDQTEKILTDTEYTITPYANGDTLNDTGTFTETISYTFGGITMTADFDIEITAYLMSVSITSLPKTDYYEGDIFTTAGLILTGTWSDSTETPFIDGWTTSPYTDGDVLSVITESEDITVSYLTFTDTYQIKVEVIPITVIEITYLNTGTNHITTSGYWGSSGSPGLNINFDYSIDDGATWSNYTGRGNAVGISVNTPNKKVLIKCGTTETQGWARALIGVPYNQTSIVGFEVKSASNVPPFCSLESNRTDYYFFSAFYNFPNLQFVKGIPPIPEGATTAIQYFRNCFSYSQTTNTDLYAEIPPLPSTITEVSTYLNGTFSGRSKNITPIDIPVYKPKIQDNNLAFSMFNGDTNMTGTLNIEKGNNNPTVRNYNPSLNTGNKPLTVNIYQKNGQPTVNITQGYNLTINYIDVDTQEAQ